RRTERQGGFTFIEIMVAVMILFIVMGVAGFSYFRWVGRSRVAAARNQVQIFSLALNAYFLDCRRYPTPEQGLAALWEKPILEPVPRDWSGPYMEREIPLDPWDHPYEYRVPGPSGLPFGLRSLGADGMEGGEGEDADIVSWKN